MLWVAGRGDMAAAHISSPLAAAAERGHKMQAALLAPEYTATSTVLPALSELHAALQNNKKRMRAVRPPTHVHACTHARTCAHTPVCTMRL
ncbi:hypothetical protein EON67_07105 [archaeon]|nr:MAG: hypothetical protein EON67_07105 [archaeon]